MSNVNGHATMKERYERLAEAARNGADTLHRAAAILTGEGFPAVVAMCENGANLLTAALDAPAPDVAHVVAAVQAAIARPHDPTDPLPRNAYVCPRCARSIYECMCGASNKSAQPEGDVVERAAVVAREAYQRAMWTQHGRDTITLAPWRESMRALHAAGLLARPVDRDVLANIVYKAVRDFEVQGGGTRAAGQLADEAADALLREIGGGR